MDLTFNSGTTTQTVMIPILGDNVVESTESFTVSLTSADSAVTLNPSTTTVTIQDDDSKFLRKGGEGGDWCGEHNSLIWRHTSLEIQAIKWFLVTSEGIVWLQNLRVRKMNTIWVLPPLYKILIRQLHCIFCSLLLSLLSGDNCDHWIWCNSLYLHWNWPHCFQIC